ncbi:hypothetical protein ANN_14762 [Periplaneta americana]|uniref:Uncharacterized protein n=1 Tax=Periplaneta americana TaxID=6978 RepID=A0ABQ8SZB8_PERAM|nr:hypothetical protein ANN_14762 [Periplaneta americana]
MNPGFLKSHPVCKQRFTIVQYTYGIVNGREETFNAANTGSILNSDEFRFLQEPSLTLLMKIMYMDVSIIELQSWKGVANGVDPEANCTSRNADIDPRLLSKQWSVARKVMYLRQTARFDADSASSLVSYELLMFLLIFHTAICIRQL